MKLLPPRRSRRPFAVAALAAGVLLHQAGPYPTLSAQAQSAATDAPFIQWCNPPPNPQPLLQHRSYHSRAMNTQVGYNIYLPPGYDTPGNTNRYPVIYWLHGRGQNENRDQFPAAVVDAAVRRGIIPPLVFVYPNGGGMSMYADSVDGQWLSETTIIRELLPHIDATFRTVATREARAVQGMSMGGYGAVKFALKYPDLFSSVAAFAGGFRSAEEMLTGANRAPREIMRRIFADDPARFRAEETRTLARSRADSVRGRLGIKLLVGSDDFLLPNNRLFKQALEEAGLAHEYTEIPGIQHDLPKLAAWLGFASLEFAVKHFGISRDASRDGPWVNPPAPAETAPAVEHHVFWSAILGRPVGYNVYLPPSYPRTNPIASSVGLPRLPVVFHLLGSGDGESTHAQHMRLLDQAIRGGEVPPAAWVWVYTGRRSWCTDHADGAVTPERMLVREFIPHFESRWDLGGSKSLRAISGWSMGGFGALKVACRYPELFASVVTYGGAFWDGDEFERRNADGWQRVFGDAAGFAANDPTTLLRERVTGLRGKFALRCIVGATDFLAPANDRLKQSLDALGYGFEYEQIPAVGHEPGAVFAHEVHRCFRFHARHFGRD